MICLSPLQEDYGSPLVYDNVLVGMVIFKTRYRGGLYFISFNRLNFLRQGLPEIIMNPIIQNFSSNSLQCELNEMNMDFFD